VRFQGRSNAAGRATSNRNSPQVATMRKTRRIAVTCRHEHRR